MKKLFLTSWVGGYDRNDENRTPTKLNNTNHFVDRLRRACPRINTITYIASSPADYTKCDEHCNRLMANLKLDGFAPKKMYLVDYRCNFDIRQAIMSSDIVFLTGGHVPTQNKFMKEIGLREILADYQGVVIGQSAGSMNSADIVYVQPEEPEDFADKNFQIQITGLGLTRINVMPHINNAHTFQYDGVSVYDMCLEDSKKIYHYGIVDSGFIEIDDSRAVSFGETWLFKDGVAKKLCDNGMAVEVSENYD